MPTPRNTVIKGGYVPFGVVVIRRAFWWACLDPLEVHIVCSDVHREMARYKVGLSRSNRDFDAFEVRQRVINAFCEPILNVDVQLNPAGFPSSVLFDIYLNGVK